MIPILGEEHRNLLVNFCDSIGKISTKLGWRKSPEEKKTTEKQQQQQTNKQTNKKKSLRYSEGTPVRIKKSGMFLGMPFVKLPTPANFVKTAHSHSIRQQAFVLDISEFKALTGNQS